MDKVPLPVLYSCCNPCLKVLLTMWRNNGQRPMRRPFARYFTVLIAIHVRPVMPTKEYTVVVVFLFLYLTCSQAFECIVFGAQKKQAKLLDRKVVYTGYFDHPQNTDNAWRELMVLHVHIHSWESIAALKTNVSFRWSVIMQVTDAYCSFQRLSFS